MTDIADPHPPEFFCAYLDESEDSNSGFYAVGGFLAETSVWQVLQPKWLKCLPSIVPTFHTTDCFTGNKHFRQISISERITLLDSLTDLICEHDVKLMGYGINSVALAKYAPRALANDFLGNKYAAPFGGVVGLVCQTMGNLPGPADWDILENGDNWEQCSFFIESNQYSPSAERTLSNMRNSADLWYRNRIGALSYGTKSGPSGIPLLQVADLGAFLVTKYISESPDGRIPWRPYFEKIKSAGRFCGAVIADDHSLEVLNKTYEELKRESIGGTSLWDGT